jgi:multiple antibiotic resistance protein
VPLSKILILSFVTLITMVNPLAVIPSFVALTDGASRATRSRIALVASMACVIALTVFLVAGNWVFKFFGITVPAFQIMGGVIFFTNALRTLVEHDDRLATSLRDEKRTVNQDVVKAELDPANVAVVPLAIPMLSGPGAITSTMVLVNLYPRLDQKLAVTLSIVGVGVVSYVVLLAAVPLSRLIGDRGRAVFTKVMALLLGAIGIQFIINGLRPVLTEIIKAA